MNLRRFGDCRGCCLQRPYRFRFPGWRCRRLARVPFAPRAPSCASDSSLAWACTNLRAIASPCHQEGIQHMPDPGACLAMYEPGRAGEQTRAKSRSSRSFRRAVCPLTRTVGGKRLFQGEICTDKPMPMRGYLLAMSAVAHHRNAFARTGTASRDTASAVPFCAQSIPNILLIRQLAD